MSENIDNPASCVVQRGITFLNARGYNADEIHYQLCETQGPTTKREGKVREKHHFMINDLSIKFPEVSATYPEL